MPKREQVSLETLAVGTLPPRINQTIDELELTVEELVEWEQSKSPVRVTATKDEVRITVQIRVPTKKLVALISSLGSLLVFVVNFVYRHWAEIQSLLSTLNG